MARIGVPKAPRGKGGAGGGVMASDARRLRMRTLRQAGPTPETDIGEVPRRLASVASGAPATRRASISPALPHRATTTVPTQMLVRSLRAFYESSGRRAASGDRSWDPDFCRQRSQK